MPNIKDLAVLNESRKMAVLQQTMTMFLTVISN